MTEKWQKNDIKMANESPKNLKEHQRSKSEKWRENDMKMTAESPWNIKDES